MSGAKVTGSLPVASLSGTVGIAQGGTGLTSTGAFGAVPTSNGSVWANLVPTAVSSKSANYTLVNADAIILGDATSAAFTLTLPTAVGLSGKVFWLKKIDSSINAITIATTSAQTINGQSTRHLATQYELLALASDGANWQQLYREIPSEWVAWTPAISAGFGTTSGVAFKSRRSRRNLEIHGSFESGTTTATAGTVSIGFNGTDQNVTADISAIPAANGGQLSPIGTFANTSQADTVTVLIEGSTSLMKFGSNQSSSGSTPINANGVLGNAKMGFICASIPITGWED